MDQLESCQPTIPQVRVSEVSGGEKSRFQEGLQDLLIQPLMVGEPSGPDPGTLLTGTPEKPSLRVYLVGWARVCPLGKPLILGQFTAPQACTGVAGLRVGRAQGRPGG